MGFGNECNIKNEIIFSLFASHIPWAIYENETKWSERERNRQRSQLLCNGVKDRETAVIVTEVVYGYC